jgi:hypothetical protein
MKYLVDETGFPLVEVNGLGTVTVWPIAKLQFERYIAETNSFGDKRYDIILGLNPRISYKYFDINNYEKLFISGIKPLEALEYAKWLGPDYDLLTLDEWRTFHTSLGVRNIPELPGNLSIPAGCIWKKLANHMNTLKDLTLIQGGLVEWVKKDSKFVGLGAPRSSFLHHVLNPLKDECVPVKERVYYLGFRLIRR